MRANEEKGTKERRSLVEGVTTASSLDRTVEEEFVFSRRSNTGKPDAAQPPVAVPQAQGGPANPVPSRQPLTTRIRSDYATALKRASLERQLSSTVPSTLQDILEEALEPWLRANGYLG